MAGPLPGFSSSSRGGQKQMEGQKPEGWGTFLKYSIECMQQLGHQTTSNGEAPVSNGGAGHHWPSRWRQPWIMG